LPTLRHVEEATRLSTYTAPVSDTTANTDAPQKQPQNQPQKQKPAEGVSMTKPSRPARVKPPLVNVPIPRTIDLACVALLVMFVGGFARALLLLGNTSTLLSYAIATNKKAKKPDKNFDAVHAVHQFRESALVQAAVIGIALLLLAWALRRSRSASATRWALLIVFFFTGMPFYVIPTSGLPVGAQVAGVVIGVASVAAILLIFIPPTSAKYFKASREANIPEEMRGKPRPGLGSLFGPKRPRGAGRTPAPPTKPASTAADRPATAKAKAKVRSDTDAVARGAELARARAKASKSRRTSD
jgi:hypothetical protein